MPAADRAPPALGNARAVPPWPASRTGAQNGKVACPAAVASCARMPGPMSACMRSADYAAIIRLPLVFISTHLTRHSAHDTHALALGWYWTSKSPFTEPTGPWLARSRSRPSVCRSFVGPIILVFVESLQRVPILWFAGCLSSYTFHAMPDGVQYVLQAGTRSILQPSLTALRSLACFVALHCRCADC